MIVVALGNPGHEYVRTRHNIAWQMLEELSFAYELNWQEKFKGEYASIRLPGTDEKSYFLKPLTFMNLSGQSIVALMQFFKLKIEDLLIVHDDLEMAYGTIGFKRGGGLGGHNGLRSTTAQLGTRDFNRLRMGISRPSHKDITSYVLGPFSQEEQIALPTYLEETAKLLELCLTDGFEAMEKPYKKKKVIQDIPK